jgi:hypothetical protein
MGIGESQQASWGPGGCLSLAGDPLFGDSQVSVPAVCVIVIDAGDFSRGLVFNFEWALLLYVAISFFLFRYFFESGEVAVWLLFQGQAAAMKKGAELRGADGSFPCGEQVIETG